MSKISKHQTQPGSRKRGKHHPTIFEAETRNLGAESVELPTAHAAFMEQLAKETQTVRFEDLGYIGGKDADKPGMVSKIFQMIEGDLTLHSALELIALGIIRAHPAKTLPSSKGAPVMRPAEQRLKAARKALTGEKPKKGRDNLPDAEQICTQAAYQFARLATGFDKGVEEQHLATIFKKLLAARLKGKDSKAKDDLMTPYRRFFRAHRERLLVKVTWYGSEEQRARRFHFARIVASLKALGVAIDESAMMEELEVRPPP